MLQSILKNWQTFFTNEGGDETCAHEYDDSVPELNDQEYSGTLVCVHCGALLHYDVADIGD